MSSRPPPFALRWRQTIWVGALVLLLLLGGVGVILLDEGSYRQQRAQEVRVQAEILAASVTAALDFGDHQAAKQAAEALAVNPQVRAAGVYERSGAFFAGYRRRENALPPTLPALPLSGDAVTAEAPVRSGGATIGTVFMASDPEPFSSHFARYLTIGVLTVMAALVALVLGVAQTALRRVNRQLEERAGALADANAELQVQMDERAKAEEQLRQAHKMQALGQLTGGIAHDFNNLLTVIQGSADMLGRPDLPPSRQARFVSAIGQAAARATALTGQLLAFARRQPLQPEVIDLNALIGGMSDLLDRTLGERIAVHTHLSHEDCAVEADRAQLESALLNVAVNARDAMPDGGSLIIATERREDMVALAVSDTGAGMTAEVLTRVFEPFFTTKATGKGTGLGLSQVYGFATQSGGDVEVDSHPGEGTTVRILLPHSRAQVTPDRPREAAVMAHRLGAILLVEDNEEVGEFAQTLLAELGHRVVRARSGAEALERIAEDEVDLVISDVVMPGMSGLELADRLKAERPDLPVILTTGYSQEIATSGSGGRPVLLKPYRLETLALMLEQVLPEEDASPESGAPSPSADR